MISNNMKEQIYKDLYDIRILGFTDNISFGIKVDGIDKPLGENEFSGNRDTDTFICYQINDRKHNRYAGDTYFGDEYTIEVDIFSSTNYADLEDTVIKVLEEKGYLMSREYEVYLTDIEMYQCILIFKYYKERKY